MLLKSADSKDEQVVELERQLAVAPNDRRSRIKRDLQILKAGIKGEKDTAYFINFDYEKSKNWAIIHDLRLEVGGRVAQIDHLLINRFLHVFVLETKSFHSGLKITEEGEFLRWNDFVKNFEGMASPLAQNERHIAVLKDAFSEIKLPSRLGVTLTPTFHSLVLISPNARVDRPEKFDTSKVIKADALKGGIDKYLDGMGVVSVFGSLAKMIDEGTLYAIGRRLTGLHKPLVRRSEDEEKQVVVQPSAIEAKLGISQVPAAVSCQEASQSPPRSSTRGSGPLAQTAALDPALPPVCKSCSKSAGSILYGQYGYYFKCSACESNTSMKWFCGTSGHSPRIRKDGIAFYRECQECGLSQRFHENLSS